MHNDPVYLLEPVYHWLDELIHQDGDYLYMALVYISLPLIIWILSGGLRRRFPQRRNIVAVPIIVIRPNPTHRRRSATCLRVATIFPQNARASRYPCGRTCRRNFAAGSRDLQRAIHFLNEPD